MTSAATSDLREILADLPYLIAVADTGGVGAAADELGVPQSTVSRSLARLAERMGAPVLARSGRGIRLTPEAEAFLPYARRALDEVVAGAGIAKRRAEERDNTATIAFQHTLGRTVVPALVRAVLDRRPDTRFELHQGARELCVEALENRQADAVLLSPPLEPGDRDGIRTLRLYGEPLVLAVPPRHPLARRRRIRVRDLEGEVMLQMRPEFGLRSQVDGILRRAGVTPRRGFEGEDIHTLRGLVAAGLGVAILPAASPPPTDVVEVPIADTDARREIGISWRAGEDSSSAARTVFELAGEPAAWLPAH